MPMKVREMIRLVEQNGWEFHSQRGSHRQYTHPVKKGRVTIPGKESADLDIRTERSILRQAGLR